VEVGPGKGNATGERQGAAMDIVGAVGLNKVWKATRATDPGDRGNFFMLQFALFDELEIKREHGEIAAAGAPGRVVRNELFF